MGLGLAHLRLTSQMRCSHLVAFFKFSAKDITLSAAVFYIQLLKNTVNYLDLLTKKVI